VSELEAEVKRLKRENEVLRQERDVLKKAMQIVDLSPTLDYAIVYTRAEYQPNVWLYRMPELP